jgi:hypothetical protein
MAPPTMWPGAAEFDAGEGLGAATSGSFTMDGILHDSNAFGHWQSSRAALFTNMPSDYIPHISGNLAAGLNHIVSLSCGRCT